MYKRVRTTRGIDNNDMGARPLRLHNSHTGQAQGKGKGTCLERN